MSVICHPERSCRPRSGRQRCRRTTTFTERPGPLFRVLCEQWGLFRVRMNSPVFLRVPCG